MIILTHIFAAYIREQPYFTKDIPIGVFFLKLIGKITFEKLIKKIYIKALIIMEKMTLINKSLMTIKFL